MMKNDVVLLHTPTKMVRASGRLPKTLQFKDVEGDGSMYFIEPEIEGDDMKTAKIFYTLPMKFARECLSDQEKWSLVSPPRMIIKVSNRGTYDSSTKIVHAIKVDRSGKTLDEMAVQELAVKREGFKIDEIEAASKGKIAEHMKEFTVAPVVEAPIAAPMTAPVVEAPVVEDDVVDLTNEDSDVTTF